MTKGRKSNLILIIYYRVSKHIHMDLFKEVGDGKCCRSKTCQAT